ncbi:ATP-binding protein [Herpetosiphon sp. NSE202]|uniref:ATP-binding protein n=1 Tax=Herpetosiphon sp. NSE202 TaxID=3351349 RepID=UPI0036365E40
MSINEHELRAAAMHRESARLLQLRLAGFVGRVAEQAAINQLIAQTRPTGGYVLVTGGAGEGKSSLIAQLIMYAGLEHTPHHFIALTPGRAYQIDLLRSIVAQLMLKHNLTNGYFPVDSYPALRLEFGRMLQTLSDSGIAETIYLDGLDQLQPEVDGSRDLTFLPLQLPPGIVIVLGARPNESFASLALEQGVIYKVPPLSEADAITRWQTLQSALDPALLGQLADSLKGNALLVELAARAMSEMPAAEVVPIIDQSIADPTNLFRLSLARIQGLAPTEWHTITRPILAVLLMTHEPLQPAVLAALIHQPVDALTAPIVLLSGWVSVAADQRLALQHLLFHDYLLQHEFSTAELRAWHSRMADWCGAELDAIWQDSSEPVEHARRWYARQHYITHLAQAERWADLWQVVDAGDYGAQKIRFEPSTRLYGLDLDRARESVIAAGQSLDHQLELLPRLWRYSLLRTSLTSHADQWDDYVFVILAVVGRIAEALAQIEICSDPEHQVLLWAWIVPYAEPARRLTILQRMEQVARSMHDHRERDYALHQLTLAYADNAMQDQALSIARTLDDTRDQTLAHLVETAINQADLAQAASIVKQIQIPKYRLKSAQVLATALIAVAEFAQARQVLTETIPFAYSEHVVILNAMLATVEWRAGNQQQSHALLIKAHARNERLSREAQLLALPALIKGYLTQGNLLKARSLDTPIESDRFRHELVLIYIDYADIATAVELAATITHWHRSNLAYAALAEWYCTHAEPDRAETMIQLIVDPHQRVKCYCSLASSYRNYVQIAELLEAVRLELGEIAKNYNTVKSLLCIANTYAEHAMHDHAHSTFEQALATIVDTATSRVLVNEHMYLLRLFAQMVKRYEYADLCQQVVQAALLTGHQAAFEYSLPFEKAKIYLNHGAIDSVRQIIDHHSSPHWAVNLFQMLATKASEQHNYSLVQSYLLAALPHAQAADSAYHQIRLLCDLATIALKSELDVLGKTMLDEASQLLATIEAENEQTWAGSMLVQSYHAYGLLANALSIVQSMRNHESQTRIITELSHCYAAHGELEQSYTTLNLAQAQPETYAWNLCQIVIKSHEQGLATITARYYSELLALCNGLHRPVQALKWVSNLALAQINYGANQYLMNLLETIRNADITGLAEYEYIGMLCEIAKAYAKQGNYPVFIDWLRYAHSITQSIVTQTRPKVVAYRYVAATYINHAPDEDTQVFLTDLLSLADGIKPSSYADDLFNCLTEICTDYAVRGHAEFFTKAYQYALQISEVQKRVQALRTLANGYADVDNRVALQALIAEIHQLDSDLGFETIAMTYAKRGDLAFAKELIINGEPWEEKDFVLEYLVPALLQAADPISAYQLVPSFDSLAKRIEALRQIVAYYVEQQHIAESIQLIYAVWRNCAVAAELWELRTIVEALDSTNPWLSIALLDGVPWVEQQVERYG